MISLQPQNELERNPSAQKTHLKIRKKVWIPLLLFCLLTAFLIILLISVRFSVNGSEDMVVAFGESYREKGASANLFGVNLSDRIQMDGIVDDQKTGTYQITYTLDGFFWVPKLTRTVRVEDITIPSLNLVLGERISVALNSDFEEPGYTADDNYDGDLTSQVKIEGTCDTQHAGDYTLTYLVTDHSGNTAKATRIVTVLDQSPLTMDLAQFTLNGYFTDVILPETKDAGEAYINGTVFIGDSITENAIPLGYYPYRNVWAKPAIQPDTILDTPIMIYGGSPTGRDIEMLTIDAAAKFQPHRVIINIGTNSVFKETPESFAASYEEFIKQFQAASPNTVIIISSIYPVDKRYDESERSAFTTNNDKCNKINYALAEMCRKNNVKFLNIAEALKDENGQALPNSLYESDGIHPLPDTYPIILEYIRTHAYLEAQDNS